MTSIFCDHDYCSPNKKAPAATTQSDELTGLETPAKSSNMKLEEQQKQQLHRQLQQQQQQQPQIDESQRGKRARVKKDLGPEFSSGTSDSYSSSEDDENDPNRPWCVCNKPHNEQFMICCDVCEYWYHGHCVGVTKLMSERFAKQNKEWFCAECQQRIDEGTPRDAIPRKIAPSKNKQQKKKARQSGKRGRGRPKKSESQTPAKTSTRNSRKSTSSIDSDNGRTRKSFSKSDARSESFGEFDNNQSKLKELIKERKREFFRKRNLAEQQRAARRNELGIGSNNLTHLSDKLDSLANNTSGTSDRSSSKPPTTGSKMVVQKIKEALEARGKQIPDIQVSSSKIEKLAADIEAQLNQTYKEGTSKYSNRFRSLWFNLKDQKNEMLVRNVLTGTISPARLAKMSPDEMAPQELAKWREMENKHSIELITREAQVSAQQVIVKKTHKGEEVIAAPSLNDPDDSNAAHDNQELPTTPTKPSIKREGTKTPPTLTSSASAESVGRLKIKIITGLSSTEPSQKAPSDQSKKGVNEKTRVVEPSLAFIDTTNNHKNHVYDMNCKICTNRKNEIEDSNAMKEASKKVEKEDGDTPQPKRFRVSIDTKLDPDSLSRLKEPLIKPSESGPVNTEIDDFNLYGETAVVATDDKAEKVYDEDEELYDPEMPPGLDDKLANASQSGKTTRNITKSDPDAQIWSGSVSLPDVAKFSAFATLVSGQLDSIGEELPRTLSICGRIAPDQVKTYIQKVKATTKNQILLVQLYPAANDDSENFNTFFDHIYTRNRCAVVEVSPQILKDFYVMPIQGESSIPECLQPIDGPGLNRKKHSKCLVGILVKARRTSPTNK